MEKRVLIIILSCFLFMLSGSVYATYYPNMNTDDPDCTNYLRDNPDLCDQNVVYNTIGPAFSINMNSIFYKGPKTWEEPELSPNCDKTLCDNFHEEGQAVCYCGLGHCCDVLEDRDEDGEKNWIYGGIDCDDSRAAVNTKAKEDCKNGMDDDCDTFIDCEDSDCSGSYDCKDLNGVTIYLDVPGATYIGDGLTKEQRANMVESPFSEATSKIISLDPISKYLSEGKECTGLGPSSGHFWDNNMGYGINTFASCEETGDPAERYKDGVPVPGYFWEETVAELNFYKMDKDASVKMAGSGWYSVPPGHSLYGDTAGNYFHFPWGSFSLCTDNPAYNELNNEVVFSGGKTVKIKSEIDGGYGSPNIGTAVIDLTFKNDLDADKNGKIDYCEYFEEKGCQPSQMWEDIGVNISGKGYNLELDDSSRLPNYFPYKYEDENKSITLAYYFNYQRPHPKLMTKVTIMTKSPVVTYTKSFTGHLNDTKTVFSIPAYDFIKEQQGSGSIDFNLLDKPCSPSAQYSSVRKVYLKTDKGDIPVSKEILSYKDYNDLINSIGSSASDAGLWVYGIIGEVSNAAGKCMKVVFKSEGEVASESNPVKLLSTFNPKLSPEVVNIPGNKQVPDFVPELIKDAYKTKDSAPVALTFKSKKDCEEWVPLHSLMVKYGGEDYSVPALMLSDTDTAINKWLSVRIPGGESECALIQQATFSGSSSPAPSSFSCGVKLDTVSLVPDFTLPVLGTPKDCKGFEIDSIFSVSTANRINAIDREYALGYEPIKEIFPKSLGLEQAPVSELKKVAVKTYPTKEECEKDYVYVNWYPGLRLIGGLFAVDGYKSSELRDDTKAYIQQNYRGDVFDRSKGGGYEHNMAEFAEKYLIAQKTKKTVSISFGWSEGGKNAYRNVWMTDLEFRKKYPNEPVLPIVLGMFRFEPTAAKPSEFLNLKNEYSLGVTYDLPPNLPYYVNVFAKQGTGVAGTSNGNDKEILIDFDQSGIKLPKDHFGVSQPIIKVLFRIYLDCLVNGKTKIECESYMNQAITDYQSNLDHSEDLLKKNYLTGQQLSEAELEEFGDYFALAQKQSLEEDSSDIFSESLQDINENNKEDKINDVLLASNQFLDSQREA